MITISDVVLDVKIQKSRLQEGNIERSTEDLRSANPRNSVTKLRPSRSKEPEARWNVLEWMEMEFMVSFQLVTGNQTKIKGLDKSPISAL